MNNAASIPAPDGQPLLMQIYLWSSVCSPGSTVHDVNAADDALIVYHEYTASPIGWSRTPPGWAL